MEYSSVKLANEAVALLNGNILQDRPIHVRLDRQEQPVREEESLTSVFVGNLPWNIDDNDLETIFSPYAPVECQVSKNMAGKSRGFAIVKFQSLAEAEIAITNLHHSKLDERMIEVGNQKIIYYSS